MKLQGLKHAILILGLILSPGAVRAQDRPQIHPAAPGTTEVTESSPGTMDQVDVENTRSLQDPEDEAMTGEGSTAASPSSGASPQDAESQAKPQEGSEQVATEDAIPYIGILVERIDPALRAHLSDLLKDRGVLVRRVERGSPAMQAGLERFDVILSLGGKAVGSTQELVDIIQSMAAGDSAKVQILRSGQELEKTVIIGQREIASGERLPPGHPSIRPSQGPDSSGTPTDRINMLQFESVIVRDLEGDRKEIEYSFKSPGGATERYTFQGSPDEIKKQVNEHKGLEDSRKKTILEQIDKDPAGFRRFLEPGFGERPLHDIFRGIRNLDEIFEDWSSSN